MWHIKCRNRIKRNWITIMNDKKMHNIIPERQKELVNILMDSELYLDMPLEERNMLLKFILQSYLYPPTWKPDRHHHN